MSLLHPGYTVTCASEQKHEETYYIQFIHYIQVFLFELFMRKVSFGILLNQNALLSNDPPPQHTIIDYYSSWTDDSSTCGEISDDSSLNSSSSWNSTTETSDSLDNFEDCTHAINEKEPGCEIESHAAMIIRRYLSSVDQEMNA